MKKSISVVAIAALFAVGSAFITKHQSYLWNVDHPENGTPGFYNLTVDQAKAIFCPGVNNVECAFVPNTTIMVKKP